MMKRSDESGRRREGELEDPAAAIPVAQPQSADSSSTGPAPEPAPESKPAEDRVGVAGSAAVRPYAWTSGRTRAGYHLELETLVTIGQRGREQLSLLRFEHRVVAELCEEACSVAEIAALLGVPLGVARVLLGDMAELGLITVHQSVDPDADVPDLALMERVLSGLRRL